VEVDHAANVPSAVALTPALAYEFSHRADADGL
jgi:hypothetical protein